MSGFHWRCALSVTGVAFALGGCGDPYADAPNRELRQGEQQAPRLPEATKRVPVAALAPTPKGAARRTAELVTNWTGETAARNYAELARVTVGAARRSAHGSAARLPTDPQLSAPGARSVGTVEVIATRPSAARRRELIVVTRETLVADGLRDQRWRVTLATAEPRRGGWVISRWEPQP